MLQNALYFSLYLFLVFGCSNSKTASSHKNEPTLRDVLDVDVLLPNTSCRTKECAEELVAALRKQISTRSPLALYHHQGSRKPRAAARKLLDTGFIVRDLEPFRLDMPIDWSVDPHVDRNWRFQLNALYPAIPFLQTYEGQADMPSLEFATRLVLDWIDFNLSQNKANDFKWYDMAAGIRGALLAYIIDRNFRTTHSDSAELTTLILAASAHVRELSDPTKLARNNHALLQLAGLAGLCRALPELRDCKTGQRYAEAKFEEVVGAQFAKDGMHLEHSPGYHTYALERITRIVDTGWLRISKELEERLRKAHANVAWLTRPDGEFPAVGDTSGGPSKSYKLPQMEATTRLFPEGGYATVKHDGDPTTVSDDGYIFFTVAHHSRAHKHHDSMSFEWFDAARPILIDSGKYGYEADEARRYIVSTRAHNTIEIDGLNIDTAPSSEAKVLAVVSTPDSYLIWAEKDHQEFSTKHRRVIVYRPGSWLAVLDDLASDNDHTYTQWFHLAEHARVRTEDSGQARAIWEDGFEISIGQVLGDTKPRIVIGQRKPRMQGWHSPKYRKMVPNPAVAFEQTGTNARFLTVFRFAPAKITQKKVYVDDSKVSLCWSTETAEEGGVVFLSGGELRLEPCPT